MKVEHCGSASEVLAGISFHHIRHHLLYIWKQLSLDES